MLEILRQPKNKTHKYAAGTMCGRGLSQNDTQRGR